MPDMSTPREAAGAAFVNGKLYIVGGWGPDQNPVGLTEIYDPGSNSWTTGAANPKPHAGAGVGVVDGKIYVVGGCDAACGTTDVQVYDPASDSWTSAAAYPGSISWLACGGIAGKLYCAGGYDGSVNASSKAYTYDPGSESWSPVADMPAADWAAGYAAADDQLLVSGGVIGTTTLTNEGWAFDPTTGAWTSLPNSNNALYRGGSACGFYKIGGGVSGADPAYAESELLPGYNSCSNTGDVLWLSEQPTSFQVAPGASVKVTVTLNSSGVGQPGTYKGAITIRTDSPYPMAPVETTMVVNPPK